MTRTRRRLAAVVLAAVLAACGEAPTGPPVRIVVPPGATFASVTDTLAAHGLVRNRLWFKLRARLMGVDRSVHAGVYEVNRAMSSGEVLAILAAGQSSVIRFTVPEGLTVFDVADLALARAGIPRDSVLAAARDTVLIDSLGLPGPTLEGFLHPDTYELPANITGRDLVRMMADGFRRTWDTAWRARLDSVGMNELQLVTLASIVEGEARADDEREIIASVYLNRLHRGMALQADPTVQYAILLRTGDRKPRLYDKDYQTPSPYNTYLQPGLPPGPVNSPSRRSIVASLYPATTPYLFFVAGPDGRHVFTRNFDEHLRAIARVRRKGT
ncbi:MAG TPA: endolytic transglycosylase MltG [Gemmatimonadales bacterium]|jgi:UPF0755 protein|nr:endolytic transglycosylase MltG [Gemmatimonadales bacterium]